MNQAKRAFQSKRNMYISRNINIKAWKSTENLCFEAQHCMKKNDGPQVKQKKKDSWRLRHGDTG